MPSPNESQRVRYRPEKKAKTQQESKNKHL
jgi:hypothetical protein